MDSLREDSSQPSGFLRTPWDSSRLPGIARVRPELSDNFVPVGQPPRYMSQKTYSEGIVSDICTGIVCKLVHGLEEITNELILAMVVVCGLFVVC
jgi:hypothetical protein